MYSIHIQYTNRVNNSNNNNNIDSRIAPAADVNNVPLQF